MRGWFIKFSASAVAAVCLIFSSLTVCAQSVVFSEKVTEKGKKADYSLSVSKESLFSGITIEINYDKEQLKIESSSAGSVTEAGLTSLNDRLEGRVRFTCIFAQPAEEGGELLNIGFTRLSEKNDKLRISVEIKEFIDAAPNDIPFKIERSKEIDSGYLSETPKEESSSSSQSGESVKTEETQSSSSKTDNESGDGTSAVLDGTEADDGVVTPEGNTPEGNTPEKDSTVTIGAINPDGSSPSSSEDADKSPSHLTFIIITAVIIAILIVVLLILYKAKFSRRK